MQVRWKGATRARHEGPRGAKLGTHVDQGTFPKTLFFFLAGCMSTLNHLRPL